jgi:hypothetical protein
MKKFVLIPYDHYIRKQKQCEQSVNKSPAEDNLESNNTEEGGQISPPVDGQKPNNDSPSTSVININDSVSGGHAQSEVDTQTPETSSVKEASDPNVSALVADSLNSEADRVATKDISNAPPKKKKKKTDKNSGGSIQNVFAGKKFAEGKIWIRS